MATENNIKNNVQTNEKTDGNSTAGGFDDVPTMRVPSGFIMLTKDTTKGEKTYEGSFGIKYGPEKSDWLRIPYLEMKKIIDFCKENKHLFNEQLEKERKKMSVGDL